VVYPIEISATDKREELNPAKPKRAAAHNKTVEEGTKVRELQMAKRAGNRIPKSQPVPY
jgi:hypothetical protein